MTHEFRTPRSLAESATGEAGSFDIYQRLLKERIVFLGTQVDQKSANLICAQLLLLEAEDPDGTSRSTSTRQAAR